MSVVKNITSPDEFSKFISSPNLSVAHFAAEWAPQCKQINDVMSELANLPELKPSGTQFCICPAEDIPEISLKLKIEAVPTIIFIRNSKLVDRIDGADVVSLTAKVKHLSSVSVSASPKEPLEERLKKLINKHNVMVFMKGNRTTPKCGFSRTLIQILQDTGVEYETFDILNDEEVRQGLKTYSDWPTYPQVYVKGDLIGGLDIIKEMLAAGELESTLKS